ncbi:MAG: ribosome-associated translation inhibitor RaiA [Bacteroidetes bacterium]|nr:ribosome-associated translation inhibitor RaiA [Bacteroidota bacterium]
MNTYLTARHFNAREELKDYVMDATSKLEKYYDGIIDCSVLLDYEKNNSQNGHHMKVVEIKVTVFNQLMKATEKSEHFEVAVDNAIDDIIRQLKKYKELKRDH